MARLFLFIVFIIPALGLKVRESSAETDFKSYFLEYEVGTPLLGEKNISSNKVKIVFYNVENLFDVVNDSLKMDEEFTPEGSRRWSFTRYKQKLGNIYRVLIAIGGWEPPGIIGLCEVENYKVLSDLVTKTPLEKLNYQIIHKESPDQRGIDVALLYRREAFIPIDYEPIPVGGRSPGEWFSREILYVKGVVFDTDTIHLFVNHWPSRSGGQVQSESRRVLAASILRDYTDSLYRHEKNPKIVIIGDFNDNPDDKSMKLLTKNGSGLMNLMTGLYNKGEGTLAHTGNFMQWHMFDQIIISKPIYDGGSLSAGKAGIFNPDWLRDKKTGRPFRTYQGPVYKGGFSDHFPVFFDLEKK